MVQWFLYIYIYAVIYIYVYIIDQARGQDGWILAEFSFCVFMDRDEVSFLIARIFPRPCGARKNTTQLAKYPRVLYVKPSNKMFIYTLTSSLV